MPKEDIGQRVAMASWLHARKVAAAAGIDVSLYTVEIGGEAKVRRSREFHELLDLNRTSRSILASRFWDPPSLPLARDILERALDVEADYIVLTLADVSLMPNFYEDVLGLLQSSGASPALSIHRVDVYGWEGLLPQGIVDDESLIKLTPFFDLTLKHPQLHPGSDCFVFERKALPLMIDAVGYVFLGGAPYGQMLLSAMDYAADLHIIEGKKWAFHLSLTRGFREGFDWKSGAPEPKEFLAYNNLAGFGLSSVPVPGYRAFPNTLAILDRAVSKFYVSTEVAMDKVGFFMDPNMCFAENGTIAGVALVLAGAPHDLTGPVMGFGVWRQVARQGARLRALRRMFELPVNLRQGGFRPSRVIVSMNIPFQPGDCFGWLWKHDWAGVYLGLEAPQKDTQYVLYAAYTQGVQVPKVIRFSKRIHGTFSIRPIFMYNSELAEMKRQENETAT